VTAKTKYQVGDEVVYDGKQCIVEKVLSDKGVYFVGTNSWFADCVSDAELKPVKKTQKDSKD
jgi:hypothetical protein